MSGATGRPGGLSARAERLGAARADRRRQEIAGEAEAMGGIAATIEGGDVVIAGRGLLDRWIRDANLRNIGRTGG